jgi:type IV secretion system protein VirD4
LLTPGEIMQLSPSDELVMLSGMAPIRANKLRYFQDRRFLARVSPPPMLVDGDYADRPPKRPHDWSECVAEPIFPDEEQEDLGGEGGLQEDRILVELDAADPLGLGEDEDVGPAGPPPLMPMRTLGPALAADAINQGSDRGGDLMPSF